jgi:hypothetical protein
MMQNMLIAGGVLLGFLVVLLIVHYSNKEKYSNFECVSVYGNQAEYLRCLEAKGCKEAFVENKDQGKLLPLSKEEKCRSECILKLGDFQDCCNVCKRSP